MLVIFMRQANLDNRITLTSISDVSKYISGWVVLDVTLTKLWHRIESLCQCAIVGVLQALAVEEHTFLACEYWTLGLTTGLIGACLLWLTLWATALPRKIHCGLLDWRRSLHHHCSSMIFGPLEPGTPIPPQMQESAQSFAT